MGKPPAYLFVVRHGLRLDVADKNWHLTSSTPYDPPLTYSGWNQAKNLGARIANIIRERVKKDETAGSAAAQTDPTAKPKRKRYEVVIHSSPFLRCIQTSVAISAGLAQDSTPFGPSTSGDNKELSGSFAHGHRARPSTASDSGTGPAPLKIVQGPVIRKCVLRLDAFLGEWLSPSYYELISPPPESVIMLASAKADLLRREDYSSYPNSNSYNHSNLQGQLWSPSTQRPLSPTISSVDPLEKDDLSSVASSLPRSDSVSSQSTCQSQPDSTVQSATQPFPAMGYVPPVPQYAVKNNNTVPPGFVAHARDACCDIDYQWDSMRAPLNWGDGGSFPEEWASMHRRFGEGIQMLVDWYSTAEHPAKMVTKTVSRFGRPVQAQESEDSDDVETESVVILVSHGAGCNALIGAITHQPVLADVAMASLTMAVRKPDQELHESIQRCQKEKTPIHHYYDLKLFANTDHLRTPGQAPNLSRSTSISVASVATARNRHTHSHSLSTSSTSSTSNFSYQDIVGGRGGVSNDLLSASRRGSSGSSTTPRFVFGTSSASNGSGGGITVGSGVSSFGLSKPSNLSTGLGRKPSMGLWSPTSLRNGTGFDDDDDDDNMVLNFGTPANDSKPSTMKW